MWEPFTLITEEPRIKSGKTGNTPGAVYFPFFHFYTFWMEP
jgi:hypothetical protein